MLHRAKTDQSKELGIEKTMRVIRDCERNLVKIQDNLSRPTMIRDIFKNYRSIKSFTKTMAQTETFKKWVIP
jgi:hypothetical protein